MGGRGACVCVVRGGCCALFLLVGVRRFKLLPFQCEHGRVLTGVVFRGWLRRKLVAHQLKDKRAGPCWLGQEGIFCVAHKFGVIQTTGGARRVRVFQFQRRLFPSHAGDVHLLDLLHNYCCCSMSYFNCPQGVLGNTLRLMF
ncbi:unnamed protein product [Discosporangium mesarthrocarpum]